VNNKVVIVEDDPTMRSLLKTLLELEGYETQSFAGFEGNICGPINNFEPSFILIDYHLRKSSGLDLLKALRSDSLNTRPYILMLSGEDMSARCIEAGADGFLLKPFMPDELICWLREREETIDVQKD
jgi:DNA-binding response OmpR family regulator